MRTVIAWQEPSALGGARDGGGGGGGSGRLPIQKNIGSFIFTTWKIFSGDGLDRRTGERPLVSDPPIGRRTQRRVRIKMAAVSRGFVLGDPVPSAPGLQRSLPLPPLQRPYYLIARDPGSVRVRQFLCPQWRYIIRIY